MIRNNKAAYSICSNDYLPYALSLGKSFISHHPSYQFYIFLIDENIESYSINESIHIMSADSYRSVDAEIMRKQYNNFELCCALKPLIADKLFKEKKEIDILFYLDTDILVFNSFFEAEELLLSNDIIITPHIVSPIGEDDMFPNEHVILTAGLYNAGFFGLRRSINTDDFLQWWQKRLFKYCYNDTKKGYFVDQIWLNYVPLFFKSVAILNHPGYNIAYWNLHERKIENTGNAYKINKTYPLVFYHFSGYDPYNENLLSKHQNRYTFEKMPVLKELATQYKSELIKNNLPKENELSDNKKRWWQFLGLCFKKKYK